jgi:polyhydroxyalkanoate synthesis regulator phasin
VGRDFVQGGSKEDAVNELGEASGGNVMRGRAVQGLRDLVERTFLTGMGVAALTKDRVEDLVDELVRVGQLNADEGRDLVDRLVARSREQARTILGRPEAAGQNAFRDVVVSLQTKLEDQELRLRQLEHRVQLLETAQDRATS